MTETYPCQACGIEVTRQRARGQRPKWCDGCRNSAWKAGKEDEVRVDDRDRRRLKRGSKPRPGPVLGPPTPRRERSNWPSCRIFVSPCQVCRELFTSRYTISTCSSECRAIKRLDDRRNAKLNYRARKRSAFVARVHRRRIYERDGWTCQICQLPLDPQALAPEPNAPTIDHILALADGGTHEPSNVQAAHFLCNAIKGSRSAA